MSNTWAYVAGIIDADGCIGLYVRRYRKTPFHHTVAVKMTHEPTVRALQTMTDMGTVYGRPANGVRKPTWTWQVARRADVITLLDNVLPFLITKRAKAQEMLRAIR